MIRARILKRDDYRCQWRMDAGGLCGAKANEVDHEFGPLDDSDEALRSLCSPHHRYKTSRDAGRASAALKRKIAAKRTRPVPPHPGLRDPGRQEAS
jgi:hypothetical protein